jgi:hypothetical protein
MRHLAESVDAALPWEDGRVERLDGALRLKVGRYWEDRAAAELQVADAFSQLAAMLSKEDAADSVLGLLDRSVKNEHYHSTLCHRLAIRYLGHEVGKPAPRRAVLPSLESASDQTRATLHVAGLCCINESIATVWIERCATLATAPLARAANQLHLADEVFHARLGWAHLASDQVTPGMRAEVGRWLVSLLKSNVGQWLGPEILGQSCGVPDHGLPSEEDHRQAVLGAVANVILPGFEHCGVDVGPARRWFLREFGQPRVAP